MGACPGCGTLNLVHTAECKESEVSRSVHKAGVEFFTGAVRDQAEGKGRYDLISPIALRRLAIVLEKGAKKYRERNWEKGIPMQRLMESTLRHLNQFLEGDRSEDHLGHAMFGCMAMIHTLEMIDRHLLSDELMNLPKYI